MELQNIARVLLDGFATTCKLFALTLVASIPLGLGISFLTRSRFLPVRWLARTFVWIIRGTPLMLQVIVVFYGPGLLWQVSAIPRFSAVIVAFIINYAAYFSEIFRGGIDAIPHGQREAAQVLGMTGAQVFFRVILLQVIKRILPPMSNEIITLVKDTSLARIIAVREIIMEAYSLSKTYGMISPLFYSGLFYLVFCGILTLLFGWLERKLDYFRV